MFYTELPPHQSLAHLIRCIWVFDASGVSGNGEDTQRIVPDGHPELVLHYGDRFAEISDDNIATTQSRLVFAGQISRQLVLRPGTNAGVIGVRFHPAGARALLGMAMVENTDMRLDLTSVWARDSEHLLDEVHSAGDVFAKVRVVEKFLMQRLSQSRIAPDAAVAHCVNLLRNASTTLTIDDLAAQSGLSSRQLERRFLHEVGIPPRLLASIFRFRRLFDAVEQEEASPGRWAGAAFAAGYFDQAHMIRDFKRFAGQPPQAFYRSLNGLSAAMVGNAP
ncbi:MAG: helix-turn-helix transcriptional regulator [Betaproteobacteria bacterium]|nr:helix-turn-helix transcriptional regulator [Betaproteobacteria bacterium]